MSSRVEFNPIIVEHEDPLSPNLQDVKEEVKEENDISKENIDEDPLALMETKVEEKSIFSNVDLKDAQEENEIKSECEEYDDFIIKEEPIYEIETEAYGLNQKFLDKRRTVAEKESTRNGIRNLAHMGKKIPHKCDECGKSFLRKHNLSQHLVIHTGEKPHNCKECGKSFSLKSSLFKHTLFVHTREKHHHCKDCGKSFTQRSDLYRHISVHTGKKPHSCEKCGKSFSLKGNLSQHVLIHTGEKHHHCKDCGKSFFQSSDLSRHVSVHTGKKPYNCEECGKSFSLKGNLTRHILIHTREKLHKYEEWEGPSL